MIIGGLSGPKKRKYRAESKPVVKRENVFNSFYSLGSACRKKLLLQNLAEKGVIIMAKTCKCHLMNCSEILQTWWKHWTLLTQIENNSYMQYFGRQAKVYYW